MLCHWAAALGWEEGLLVWQATEQRAGKEVGPGKPWAQTGLSGGLQAMGLPTALGWDSELKNSARAS